MWRCVVCRDIKYTFSLVVHYIIFISLSILHLDALFSTCERTDLNSCEYPTISKDQLLKQIRVYAI